MCPGVNPLQRILPECARLQFWPSRLTSLVELLLTTLTCDFFRRELRTTSAVVACPIPGDRYGGFAP